VLEIILLPNLLEPTSITGILEHEKLQLAIAIQFNFGVAEWTVKNEERENEALPSESLQPV
jgi:hypothetical protein